LEGGAAVLVDQEVAERGPEKCAEAAALGVGLG